jgi:hypothetical protein
MLHQNSGMRRVETGPGAGSTMRWEDSAGQAWRRRRIEEQRRRGK